MIDLPWGGALSVFGRSRKVLVDELENADRMRMWEMSSRTGKKSSQSQLGRARQSLQLLRPFHDCPSAAPLPGNVARAGACHVSFPCTCCSVHFVQRIRVSIATPSGLLSPRYDSIQRTSGSPLLVSPLRMIPTFLRAPSRFLCFLRPSFPSAFSTTSSLGSRHPTASFCPVGISLISLRLKERP